MTPEKAVLVKLLAVAAIVLILWLISSYKRVELPEYEPVSPRTRWKSEPELTEFSKIYLRPKTESEIRDLIFSEDGYDEARMPGLVRNAKIVVDAPSTIRRLRLKPLDRAFVPWIPTNDQISKMQIKNCKGQTNDHL